MSDTRLATPDDYDQFMTLAAAYLVELRELGSEIQVTTKSLAFWTDLFELYAAPNNADGVVVMSGDVGFSIAGSMWPTDILDTDFGRTAYGHGTYVHPDHRRRGLSTLLRDRMRTELKLRGFQTIVGGVHLRNDVAAQSLKNSTFTWYQLVGYETL